LIEHFNMYNNETQNTVIFSYTVIFEINTVLSLFFDTTQLYYLHTYSNYELYVFWQGVHQTVFSISSAHMLAKYVCRYAC